MDTNEYLDVFIDESIENLQLVNNRLLELEATPTDVTHIQEIFRAAHTLKGMAATMGFEDLSNLTHQLENVLDQLRNETLSVTPNVLDTMFEALEALETMVDDISNGGDGKQNNGQILQSLKAIEAGEIEIDLNEKNNPNDPIHNHSSMDLDEFELTVVEQANSQGQNIFEINVSLDDECLLKAARVYMVFNIFEQYGSVIKSNPTVEELENEEFEQSFDVLFVTEENLDSLKSQILNVSEVKEVQIQNVSFNQSEIKDIATSSAEEVAATVTVEETTEESNNKSTPKPAASKSIRVNIERLDDLMNLFEELIIDRGHLEQLAQTIEHHDFKETVERMTRTSSELQNVILKMRMVPIDQVFNRFPRMVRSLSKELGKSIDLEVLGAETELDRTVIDEIGDPLVHLIRNAIDHGVETPEQRKQLGKPETGKLILKAYHSGNHVFVEIQDDGAGIHKEKVLNKAIQNQVISKEETSNLTDQQIYELIMSSGFSTAEEISDISGRGVGLDVVKNTIESLGGTIEIDSELNEGTTFSIKLPLTLSIISALLIRLNTETYAIPLSTIMETAVIQRSDIYKVQDREVIDFRGQIIPLVNLREVFNVDVTEQDQDVTEYSIVIVRKGNNLAGLIVDSFIGQKEIVLKNLGTYLKDVFGISGATILGDGEVALILDTNALIK
ncbi:chemotaxis protein CheA [Piscibacillus halophilus]|mgnify:CR=1 FL=1|uniref:Chemotaxis protein CheA n=1 Tax=Piscibacillus halophilus TaxID=571933 RepID=A0A1H8YZQ9_9BACI|nr:chemotaxis protein CheA [Piscibacillus halophilus]SEP57680.1 two-component system, chemotaxis family, sensor kinase CheA [Piscibacillus halophilus]